MRILLIATNRHKQLNSRMNAQPLPIGLAYIANIPLSIRAHFRLKRAHEAQLATAAAAEPMPPLAPPESKP